MVAFLAILLIASAAIFYWATGVFGLNSGLICAVAVCAIGGAAYDAWRPRQGALHYAAGEWVLAQGEHESQGTLRVVLDLQSYLLVRFTAASQPLTSLQKSHTPASWLHLESAYGQDWCALRRALYAAPTVTQPNDPAAATSRVGTGGGYASPA